MIAIYLATIALVVPLVAAPPPKRIDAPTAIDFLSSMQADNGGFRSFQNGNGELTQPTLRTTRTAIRTFRMLGTKPPNRDHIILFLLDCYDAKSGGFAATPSAQPDPISTSVALMILKELELPNEPFLDRALAFMNEQTKNFEQVRMVASSLEELNVSVPNAQQWIKTILDGANPDGTFGSGPGKARTTALNAVAILRLGGSINAEHCLEALRVGQHTDGGFGDDTTADPISKRLTASFDCFIDCGLNLNELPNCMRSSSLVTMLTVDMDARQRNHRHCMELITQRSSKIG